MLNSNSSIILLQNGKILQKVKLAFLICLILKNNFNSIFSEDNILKLQNELNDVTNIMKKNLSELLKREEALDTLMSKSKDLSTVSVEFYKKAKKANNRCCNY